MNLAENHIGWSDSKTLSVARLKKRPQKFDLAVIAIGASAGGYRALREFFATVDSGDGLTIVVAQHLDESGRRLALESLQTLTTMPVEELKSGLTFRENRVYALPPHTLFSFRDGKVALSRTNSIKNKLAVIDHLFTAIGAKYKEAAIGVVLSGQASDGAQGLHAINEHGGLTVAQEPETAEHSSMPQNAISTGAVDLILNPKVIWKEVSSYIRHIRKGNSKIDRKAAAEQLAASIPSICEILYKKTQHDFKHYKTSTLLRRIQRRMHVLQVRSIDKYVELLASSDPECETLFKELLINVTNFFRDQEAFETLQAEVLKPLVKNARSGRKLRIWIAGCSTGEEAYSVAILVRELTEKMVKPPEVQIIATDIDDSALSFARKGIYSATIAEHVSEARLAKYFTKRAGRFVVTKEIREMCLFSLHNLIADPPFAQLDLICCRNVMIYLGPHLQKKLFPVFHYALKVNGYLFLGSSETFTSHKELFRPISSKLRIAQRKTTALKLPPISTSVHNYLAHFHQNEKVSEADIGLIAQRIALDEMPLRYAVVNDEGQIITSSAGINKYIQIPEGTFANHVLKLVAPGLRAALRKAFATAQKEKRKVTNDTCTIKFEDAVERTLVIVQPMPQLGDSSDLYWVAFQSLGRVNPRVAVLPQEGEADQGEIVDQLERELGVVRQELDKSVQDLEATNEELKSSNEELLSMNEELQSANEELEASKEEVQNSNDLLQKTNTDLENLLSSTEIATLFLDEDYVIKGFTPAIRDIYAIQPTDLGRRLSDLSSLSKDMPAYPQVADGVIENGEESELTLPDGRSLLRRILPYRTHEGKREGIVATFIDVTELKKSENRFYRLANSVPLIIWTVNTEDTKDFYNERWYEYVGLNRNERPNWSSFVHPEDLAEARQLWQISQQTGQPYTAEYRLRRHDGAYRWHKASARNYRSASGGSPTWFGTCVDIHDQRVLVDAMSISESHFRTLVDKSPAIMWITDREAKCTYLSQQWYETTGGTPERDLGYGWVESVHPDDKEAAGKAFFSAVNARGRVSIRYRLRQKDGSYRWAVDSGLPLTGEHGEFLGYIGTVIDIHDQVQIERRVLDLTERFERSAKATKLGVWYCDLPFDELIWNEEVKRHFFMPPDQRVTIQDFYAHIHPEDRALTEQAIAASIKNRAPYDIVYRTIDPNDSSKLNHIRAIGWTDYDSENNPIRFDGITLDVSELVRAQNAREDAKLQIEIERKNFRRLFQQTPEMVCILDGPEHRFEFVNEAHVRVLGFDATGKTVREAQPESVEVHGILDAVYRTGETAELFEIPVTVGGRLRYFNLTYAARRDVAGDINGIMILGMEITESVLAREGLRRQGQALELAIANAPLSSVLEMLCRSVEDQAGSGLLASILIASADGNHLLHGAAPGLPKEYNDAIHGIEIGESVGSCGTAAFLKKPIFVSDISTDPLWKNYKDLALKHGFRSCWSKPILNSQGRLLGTFAIYSRVVRIPAEREKAILKVAAQNTALILERKTEIEERILTAKEVERSREELYSFFMQTPTPMVILTGPEHRFTLANPLYEKYFGRRVVGKTLREVFDDFERETYEPLLDRVYKTGEPFVGRALPLKVRGSDGLTRESFVDVSYTAFRDNNGQVRGILVFIRDVTEQKAAEEALLSAKVASENASLAKTAFLANMSHEIRTPLAAIVGFSELLQQKMSGDADADNYINRILRNSTQLSKLIDELLDLSKIEADKLELEITAVDIDAILEDVRSTMILRAAEKSLNLQFEWISEKPAVVFTDRLRLTQILINVVGNAVKFTEKGSVRVELGAFGQQLRVRISDTGIGLSIEQQKRIFEPFMQADASVNRKYGGTGLGLALSSKMAKLMGGELTLEKSELGKGTSFILALSIADKGVDFSVERQLESLKPVENDGLKGRRILVVDDSSDNRFIVGMALTTAGAQVVEADNGEVAVKMAMEASPDLILMDIQMPIMDGYAALGRLKDAGFKKPVVALTANAFKEERDRCMAAGFSGYITKPISRAVLIRNVSDLLK